MTGPEPVSAQPDADRDALVFTVRKLMRACNRAATATTLRAGGEDRPYVSLTAAATDIDGSPILLLSTLADHTRNLERDARLSMLFEDCGHYANPQQGPRVTLIGRIEKAGDAQTLERLRRRYLARHPRASLYAGFGDFAFFKVVPERVHWVGGFGRAAWLNQSPACSEGAVAAFSAAEPDLIGRVNAEQDEMLRHLGGSVLKIRARHWKCVAADPDGIDLSCAKRVYRVAFPKPLTSPAEALPTLANLAVLGRNEAVR